MQHIAHDDRSIFASGLADGVQILVRFRRDLGPQVDKLAHALNKKIGAVLCAIKITCARR